MTLQQGQETATVSELQHRIAKLDDENTNLKVALQHSRTIGAAIGITMVTYKVTEDQAFEMLVAISMKVNRKVHVIASELVFSGSIDGASSK